jgi:transcriptional activator of cad operon
VPFDTPFSSPLRIGDWTLNPASGEMSRGEQLVRLEERPLRLLLCLAARAGEVLSMDELLGQVWPDVVVSPDSLYQAITLLRRQLGDDTRQPAYIATVPRRGYRLIAQVSAHEPAPPPQAESALPAAAKARPRPVALAALLACAVAIGLLVWQATAGVAPAAHPRAIAVLPFLDLTDDMNEEPFADGMAEELIGKLSKMPGVEVSPAASSYHFKDKRPAVAEVAKALNVAFVLDGSVRKSGSTLRVAARLTRAGDGFVIWSENYDRAWNDKLMIQEDIAGEVSKALAKSIH